MIKKGVLMMKTRKGFTLMEVVIVLAVIAIISAIVIPSYTGYTERSRLRSDIQSTRVIQSAIDLHRAETGKDAGGRDAGVGEMLEYLVATDYLNSEPELQSDGAVWVFDAAAKKIRVDITGCSDGVKRVVLSDIEKSFVISG